MTVDAFYTSEIGIKDIDYRGNSAMGSYPAPTESIAYALKKSRAVDQLRQQASATSEVPTLRAGTLELEAGSYLLFQYAFCPT